VCVKELTGHAEKILQMLELPYRKIALCTGVAFFFGFSVFSFFPGPAHRKIALRTVVALFFLSFQFFVFSPSCHIAK
jgi:hypothetical protein